MKRIKVGTYYRPEERSGRPVRASHINAYTYWYNTNWPGCVEYEVEAANGTEAKRVAVRRRLEHEQARERASEERA